MKLITTKELLSLEFKCCTWVQSIISITLDVISSDYSWHCLLESEKIIVVSLQLLLQCYIYLQLSQKQIFRFVLFFLLHLFSFFSFLLFFFFFLKNLMLVIPQANNLHTTLPILLLKKLRTSSITKTFITESNDSIYEASTTIIFASVVNSTLL